MNWGRQGNFDGICNSKEDGTPQKTSCFGNSKISSRVAPYSERTQQQARGQTPSSASRQQAQPQQQQSYFGKIWKEIKEYNKKKEEENNKKILLSGSITTIESIIKFTSINDPDKNLLSRRLENLKTELYNLTLTFNNKKRSIPNILSSDEYKRIDEIIKKYRVINPVDNYKPPEPDIPLADKYAFWERVPKVPNDGLPSSHTKKTNTAILSSVNIPQVPNLIDLMDDLGTYDDILTLYINNKYDFLTKYSECITSFINTLKIETDKKSYSSLTKIQSKIEEYKSNFSSKIQGGQSVLYTDVQDNVIFQINLLIELHGFFTKLFIHPKQATNEVKALFKKFDTNNFNGIKYMFEEYNKGVLKKKSEFLEQLSKINTYRNLVEFLISLIDELKNFVYDFIMICKNFVDLFDVTHVQLKESLENVIVEFYDLQWEENNKNTTLIQKINEKLKLGGRRYPITKPKKPVKKPAKKATMNMKDVKGLCKANQIKLSKTKDGVRVIYTKKELITKLKRKKIL